MPKLEIKNLRGESVTAMAGMSVMYLGGTGDQYEITRVDVSRNRLALRFVGAAAYEHWENPSSVMSLSRDR